MWIREKCGVKERHIGDMTNWKKPRANIAAQGKLLNIIQPHCYPRLPDLSDTSLILGETSSVNGQIQV